MATAKIASNYTDAMDIRAMVKDTIRTGKDIDRHIEGSNTLLHLAVKKDLVDCVVKLLSSGADANLVNDEGSTARDIAVDNGNQVLLQVLSRREEYTMHLRLFNRCTDVSSSNSGMDQFQVLSAVDAEEDTTDSKMVPLCIGAIYEDYIDWTDSQRCNHLQKLVDALRNEEFDLKRGIEALNARRIRNNTKLQDLHHSLRDREHALCLEVWAAIQAERHSRRGLERASSEVERVKGLLKRALEYVHYKGTVRVAPYKRVFFTSWHYSRVEITGSTLVVDSPREDCVTKICGTSDQTGSRGAQSRDAAERALSESDGGDVDTDASGAGSTLDQDAVLAAHALGRDGLPPSSSASHTSMSYATSTSDLAASQGKTSKSKHFISYSTGPVRRKLKKMHASNVNKRTINVQDVVGIEIIKEDRSLGAAYVQIELRIHYVKEGHGRLANSLLFSPQVKSSSFAGPEGGEPTRERLMSSSSGNGSIAGSRSSSTGSNSGVAGLLPGLASSASTPAKAMGASSSKQRSISTGGKPSASAATSLFDPRAFVAVGTGSSDSTVASAASSSSISASLSTSLSASSHADKLETIWFKLPLQTNTTTRAAASGKKKKSIAADDGSGGPTLTFELFIAIMKRVRENVRVYSVVHGVETPYRVNPVAGDTSVSGSQKGTAASTPSRTSKTAVVGSPSAFGASSPNNSFRKRNNSSGNLTEASANFLFSAPLAPPRHPVASTVSAARYQVPPIQVRTSSVGSTSSGSGSCRTDSSSLSPKRNANSATFSSRLSGAGSYQGGSMNSASGLTSIESLVSASSSRSSRTSMSASGSLSSSGSHSYGSALSMGKGLSPRYGHKLMAEGALLEETTADLEDMEDDDEGSEASPLQAALITDDEASGQEEPRFLKLTRRHTEGNQTLSGSADSRVPAAMAYAKQPEQDSVPDALLSGEATARSAAVADALTCVPDASSNPSGLVLARPPSPALSRALPGSPRRMSISGDDCPSTPAQGDRARRATASSFDAICPDSAPALHRADSKGSLKGAATDARLLRRSSDVPSPSRRETGGIAAEVVFRDDAPAVRKGGDESGSFLTLQTGGNSALLLTKAQGGAEDEQLIRYPVKLSKMLEKARTKRSKIEMRLVELLTSREKMRECIQYLQSLRAIVDNPPVTPTRTLAKTKAPSIDKAMLLLTLYGDHINQITEGLPSSSALRMMASPAPSDFRGNLNDAEEFVRVMLHVNHTTLSSTTVTSYGYNEFPGFNYAGDRESFSSARGSISAAQRMTSNHSASPLVRRLFTEECASRTNSALRQSFAQSPNFLTDPTPQLLRSPPPGYKADFDQVMSHLEEIWNCELESFQTVERLAQCLAQRGQTFQRLKLLREQEQSMVLPTKEDLYDVDF